MRRQLAVVTFTLGLVFPSTMSSPGMAGADSALEVGMSREQVLALLGAPEYERLERNGIRCLAYRMRESHAWLPKPLLPRDGLVVAMQAGALVGTERVLYSEIAQSCSRIASAWDHPPDDYTCFRKFWLRC